MQKNAERQVPNIWVSPNEHYFGAASCHPHCGEGQGDDIFSKSPILTTSTSIRLAICATAMATPVIPVSLIQ
jgi:hypothetical protein